MTADQLLAVKRPEDLFPGDADAAKRVYHTLSRAWHPDVVGGSATVFAHISALYREALARLDNGRWEGTAEIKLRDVTGVDYVLHTRASAKFALGQMLLADHEVNFLVEPAHASLFENAQRALGSLTYKNNAMRQEFERYFPKDPITRRLADGRLVLQVNKTPDLLLLRDVITHLGPLDPKHVAWIVSSLLNLSCYLTYTGVVHHDISPDTYFISPEHHSGALLGGWWYAVPHKQVVGFVPKRTYAVMPFKAKLTKRASTLTDLECIRETARECLGGRKAPEPMHSWLNKVEITSAYEQYKDWAGVLTRTFGKRRFAVMSVDVDQVYGTKVKVS